MRLVGVIVAFDASDYRFTFCLDDSSGQIVEVTCARDRTGITPSANSAAIPPTSAQPPTSQGRTLSGISIDLAGFDVGSVVKVKGGVGAFRGERQLELERISTFPVSTAIHLVIYSTTPFPLSPVPTAQHTPPTNHRSSLHPAPIPTTTAEATAWHEATLFHSTVLSTPWFLTPAEQRHLQEEADGTAQRAAEKARRAADRETRRRKRAGREKTAGPAGPKRGEQDGDAQGRAQKRRVSDKENEGV